MTNDFQKRLFEPFAQEHTGSRTKFSGTGLGMPITKKLIEKKNNKKTQIFIIRSESFGAFGFKDGTYS